MRVPRAEEEAGMEAKTTPGGFPMDLVSVTRHKSTWLLNVQCVHAFGDCGETEDLWCGQIEQTLTGEWRSPHLPLEFGSRPDMNDVVAVLVDKALGGLSCPTCGRREAIVGVVPHGRIEGIAEWLCQGCGARRDREVEPPA